MTRRFLHGASWGQCCQLFLGAVAVAALGLQHASVAATFDFDGLPMTVPENGARITRRYILHPETYLIDTAVEIRGVPLSDGRFALAWTRGLPVTEKQRKADLGEFKTLVCVGENIEDRKATASTVALNTGFISSDTRVYQGIDLRIARGDRVALLTYNGSEFVECFFGPAKAGLVVGDADWHRRHRRDRRQHLVGDWRTGLHQPLDHQGHQRYPGGRTDRRIRALRSAHNRH